MNDRLRCFGEDAEVVPAPQHRAGEAMQTPGPAPEAAAASRPCLPRIVPAGDQPLIVQMMRENLGRLSAAASQLQHAEAEALYAEGMTMEEIANFSA